MLAPIKCGTLYFFNHTTREFSVEENNMPSNSVVTKLCAQSNANITLIVAMMFKATLLIANGLDVALTNKSGLVSGSMTLYKLKFDIRYRPLF